MKSLLKFGALLVALSATPLAVSAATHQYRIASKGLAGGPAALPAGYVTVNGKTWMPALASTLNYAATVAYCAGTINGTTGWRVPTTSEIQELGAAWRANTIPYRDWQSGPYFWTNPPVAADLYNVMSIEASSYGMGQVPGSYLGGVTCVK